MVKDVKFSDAIAIIVTDDKIGVIKFLRSQGIAISPNSDEKEVIRTLFGSFNSEKFRERFKKWVDTQYQSELNISGDLGTLPNPFEELMSGVSSTTPITSPATTTGTSSEKKDGFLSGINAGQILNFGFSAFQTGQQGKIQRDLANAQIKAEEIKLQALVEQGKLSTQQMQQQLDLLKVQTNAPQSQTLLYVIGGVVLLGALGTAIYFATRKK